MGDLDEFRKAAGAAELRKIAGDRPGLPAEVSEIMIGWAEGKGPGKRRKERPSPS